MLGAAIGVGPAGVGEAVGVEAGVAAATVDPAGADAESCAG
jgi:hypothetical protein